MSEKWLVAYDFSEQATAALRRAAVLLSGLGGGQLVVAHIHRPMSTGFGAEFASVSPAFKDADRVIEDSATAKLVEVLEPLGQEFPLVTFRSHVEAGYPPDRVAALAIEEDVAQVVMGSHGRRGLERFFLGSVAERVARLADRPVLIFKTPESTD